MTGIQFRPSIYIAQSNPLPEPAKEQKKPEDLKTEEKTEEQIRENIPLIKGEPLLKEILMLGFVVREDIATVIKNDGNETGYPNLCRGLFHLSYEKTLRFKKVKATTSPISIEEIAQEFKKSMGKRVIWFISDFNTYQEKETQEKLKAVILKIWNTKNGGEPVKNFKDIIEK